MHCLSECDITSIIQYDCHQDSIRIWRVEQQLQLHAQWTFELEEIDFHFLD